MGKTGCRRAGGTTTSPSTTTTSSSRPADSLSVGSSSPPTE
jgi:hypothetical protein